MKTAQEILDMSNKDFLKYMKDVDESEVGEEQMAVIAARTMKAAGDYILRGGKQRDAKE